jgi:hypothetical protein
MKIVFMLLKTLYLELKIKQQIHHLDLLSNRSYLQNPDVYNTTAPQTFWVNEQDEMLTSDISGQTLTQLNNQFIWTINYDSIELNTVSKVTENIGNSFY